jgi:two-component system response regulator FlrC
MGRVLVVDDEDGVREFLAEALELDDHEVSQAADGMEALERLSAGGAHVVLTDLSMPRMDGMELVRRVRSEHPDTEVVVLTARGTVDAAVEAMKLGVFDFLQKPLESPTELRLIVNRALERHRLRAIDEAHRPEGEPVLSYGAPAMTPVVEALQRVASTPTTVLLMGESGTGKEVAARAIHAWSGRTGPFVAVNCAALSSSLLESELFGHEKGAFTGASSRRRGKVELADGGTFFLDEVGELEPNLQAKLLRVLQERVFERVGGNQTIAVDVRWIAATNRDLQSMMQAGSFREDLYHRLAVFPIRLPALRQRREDIVPLAGALLEQIGAKLGRPRLRLDPACNEALVARPWRGNVRELANALERAAILADGETLHPSAFELADGVAGTAAPAASAAVQTTGTLAELEKQAIEASLARHEGNRKLVAEELDLPVRTLYDKIKRHGLG